MTLNSPRTILAILTSSALLFTLGCKSGGEQVSPAPETKESKLESSEKIEAPPEESNDASAALDAAVAHELRSEEARARDAFRHPKETLEFFGVQPDHHVLELWAGGGWYTQILAPYLIPNGKLYATSYPVDSEREIYRKMASKLALYLGEVEGGNKVGVLPLSPPPLELELDSQVDVVLTFRNVHNWVKGGYDKEVYAAAYTALKPGGVFGVVEHRGPEGMTREESAKSGYMDQATVIADIEAAGFKLVATSEINANPNDTADHPEGVWTLPPRLRLGDVDREKYVAIGESDRMTLKFIKPTE